MALAVAGAGFAGAAMLVHSHVDGVRVVREHVDVAAAAGRLWRADYLYRETFERDAGCVVRTAVPAGAFVAGPCDADGDGDTGDGAVLEFPSAAACAFASTDMDPSDTTGVPPGSDERVIAGTNAPHCTAAAPPACSPGWGAFLDAGLAARWTFVLHPGRTAGVLRHESGAEFPWRPEPALSIAGRVRAEDSRWVSFDGGELHADTEGDVVVADALLSCAAVL